jgi:hypothetical protein
MTPKVSFIQLAFADKGARFQGLWFVALGAGFRARYFCLLGQFLANFSVLTGGNELQRVYGLLSQTIENKQETQLTAT